MTDLHKEQHNTGRVNWLRAAVLGANDGVVSVSSVVVGVAAARGVTASTILLAGVAALVAAYVGFNAEPTIEGTSVATTRAVVNASLLVLMFNFVLSAFLFR